MDPSTISRDVLFQTNRDRLSEFAHRAIERGMTADEFLVLLIDVDDSTWRYIVDYFMPNEDWQAFRDRGEKPIARITATIEMADYLIEAIPDLAVSLSGPAPTGMCRAVVLGASGGSVYLIIPKPEKNVAETDHHTPS